MILASCQVEPVVLGFVGSVVSLIVAVGARRVTAFVGGVLRGLMSLDSIELQALMWAIRILASVNAVVFFLGAVAFWSEC